MLRILSGEKIFSRSSPKAITPHSFDGRAGCSSFKEAGMI